MRIKQFFTRKLIVNSSLQLLVITYCISLTVFVSGITFICQTLLRERLESLGPVGSAVAITLMVTVLFLVALILGLMLTNRIAGPIYRLRCHMEEIANNKPVTKIAFREDDYFKELLEPYNTILERLSDRK